MDAPRRLSVNLGTAPAAALDEYMEHEGCTATEAIRRALSIQKFFLDQEAQGWRPAITKNGKTREALW